MWLVEVERVLHPKSQLFDVFLRLPPGKLSRHSEGRGLRRAKAELFPYTSQIQEKSYMYLRKAFFINQVQV